MKPFRPSDRWLDDRNAALLVDLYELTMIQAYWRERMFDQAVFSLFVRRLPQERNQAHDDEYEAFQRFAELYPETILLVDTYDSLEGVRKVVRLAKELKDRFKVRGVRLDSGDLIRLAFDARKLLDAGGLEDVAIFASSGLDEYEIRKIAQSGAPIAAFGVGTGMGVSSDAPSLDTVYKLTAYSGKARLKTSSGKAIYPGRKQIFRQEGNGSYRRDLLARHDEALTGIPLLRQVMAIGKRLQEGQETLEDARARAESERAKLPPSLLELEYADPPYPVEISDALLRLQKETIERVT